MTSLPVPASAPLVRRRCRFVFTPTLSLEYQDRICFTRSVVAEAMGVVLLYESFYGFVAATATGVASGASLAFAFSCGKTARRAVAARGRRAQGPRWPFRWLRKPGAGSEAWLLAPGLLIPRFEWPNRCLRPPCRRPSSAPPSKL